VEAAQRNLCGWFAVARQLDPVPADHGLEEATTRVSARRGRSGRRHEALYYITICHAGVESSAAATEPFRPMSSFFLSSSVSLSPDLAWGGFGRPFSFRGDYRSETPTGKDWGALPKLTEPPTAPGGRRDGRGRPRLRAAWGRGNGTPNPKAVGHAALAWAHRRCCQLGLATQALDRLGPGARQTAALPPFGGRSSAARMAG
jgi:hypothetical protein